MTPFFVLLVSWALLRGLGTLGVERLNAWPAAGVGALALIFGFTGTTHFSSMASDYVEMPHRMGHR